jgi:hypothetical protein
MCWFFEWMSSLLLKQINIFGPAKDILAFSELPPFQKLQFLIGDFCLSFNTELGFSLDQFSKKLLCKMMKERAILIESGTRLILCFFYFICHSYILRIINWDCISELS